jgi:hypothetical protein
MSYVACIVCCAGTGAGGHGPCTAHGCIHAHSVSAKITVAPPSEFPNTSVTCRTTGANTCPAGTYWLVRICAAGHPFVGPHHRLAHLRRLEVTCPATQRGPPACAPSAANRNSSSARATSSAAMRATQGSAPATVTLHRIAGTSGSIPARCPSLRRKNRALPVAHHFTSGAAAVSF